MKYKYEIILGLITIALASSIIISIKPIPEICDPNSGCDVTLNSAYAFTLGIKNSYMGIIGFSAIFLILLSHIKNPTHKKKKVITFLLVLGSAIAVYFIAIQFFVLKAYCNYCLIVDISLIIALIFLIISSIKNKN